MLGPKDLAEYIKEFASHPGAFVAPALDRDVAREHAAIDSYLSHQNVHWMATVRAAGTSIPAMHDNVRCVLLVPARYEERRICNFLNALLNETTQLCTHEPKSLEVIVLENWFKGESRDRTALVVRNWNRERHPSFLVHHLIQEWPEDDKCVMALSRKLLADVALWRAHCRNEYVEPLYLLTEDADTLLTQGRRTESFIEYLDKNPGIDAVCGIEERERTVLARNDLLLLDRRTWFFSEILLSSRKYSPAVRSNTDFHWNRVVTPGANFCISAETYALIRGYSTDVRIFEDMDIGQRVSVLRGGWANGRFVPNVSTIRRLPLREESSASRAILALSRGAVDPYEGGEEGCSFFDRRTEQIVRNQPQDSLLNRMQEYAQITDDNKYRFEEVLSMHYREVVRILRDATLGRRVFARVLWLLGFGPGDYKMQDNNVVLHRVDRFRSFANRFGEFMDGDYGYMRYKR